MSVKILDLVECCAKCPRRTYYSGGVDNCGEIDKRLPSKSDHAMQTGFPSWCPLVDYPDDEKS